jgi:hypothetical protein
VTSAPRRESGCGVRLLELVAGALVLRRARSDAVKADLCRFAPATEDRQHAAVVEQVRRSELGFGPLVAVQRIAAAHVEQVVRAHVPPVADTERKASEATAFSLRSHSETR